MQKEKKKKKKKKKKMKKKKKKFQSATQRTCGKSLACAATYRRSLSAAFCRVSSDFDLSPSKRRATVSLHGAAPTTRVFI
jgi:hypothetical protein